MQMEAATAQAENTATLGARPDQDINNRKVRECERERERERDLYQKPRLCGERKRGREGEKRVREREKRVRERERPLSEALCV